MTSVLEMTIEELKRKLENIGKLGWIRTTRRGNSGVGHTLEGLLGYAENNVALPDWGVFELKTARRDAKTPVTLLAKSPRLTIDMERAEFVKTHGYWDDKGQRWALYITLDALQENSRGWMMSVDRTADRIDFRHHGETIAYQAALELREGMSAKVKNLILVIADRKKEGKDEFFRYSEAYLLVNADVNRLLDLIESGDVTFDWRMHLRADGGVRDHGPGYRMLEPRLVKLYDHQERLI